MLIFLSAPQKTIDRNDYEKPICCNCGTHHICDVNTVINLKNYVPLERWEFTSVDSEKISDLTTQALQARTLDEAGTKQQATA